MRIGFTNYYTATRHIYTQDPTTKSIRPHLAHGYVLSVYNQDRQYIDELVSEMRKFGILGTYRNTIGEEDIPLPHILIIQESSVEKLEKMFKEQGIELPENRFEQKTDWIDILDFEINRNKWQIHRPQKQKAPQSFFKKISEHFAR